MSRILIVYVTDAWHSKESREMIGVCTTLDNCFKVIRAYIRKWNTEKLTDYDKECLRDYRQTFGRDNNYDVVELEKNVLI